jgi:hypothetical protein
MTNALRRHLEARIASLSQIQPAPSIASLSLDATFQRPCVFRRFPTRPRRPDGSWQEDTSIRPRLDARGGGTRARDFIRVFEWLEVRRPRVATPGPVAHLVLGGPGSGKSALLAWEYCERARQLLATQDDVARKDRPALPIHVPAGAVALPQDHRREAAASFWHGETTRLIKRIAAHATSAAAELPEPLRAAAREELASELKAGRVVLLIEDFDRLSAGADGAPDARALFAQNLRMLLDACAGIDVIMTSRFVDVRAPDIGVAFWRVWELLPWGDNEVSAFVQRFAAQRAFQPALGRRLGELLNSSGSIERFAATPLQLALLCSAVADEPSADACPAATVLRRVARLQLDRAGIAASECESALAALADLALAECRGGVRNLEARDVACLAAANLVARSGDDSTWQVAEDALRDALAASALASEAGCLDELRGHLAPDDPWWNLFPLVAALLRGAGAAEPEDLIAMALDHSSSVDPGSGLARATACAAAVPDLSPETIDRIVAVVRRALEEVATERSKVPSGLRISIESESPFRVLMESSIAEIGRLLGNLWQGRASSPALDPLRRSLHALIAADDPLLRRRGINLAEVVAPYDSGLREVLFKRLSSRVEPDDDVRSAAADAVSSLARVDWRVRELLVVALDEKRERDVSVRSAAAFAIRQNVAYDPRLRDAAIAALNARREPSDTVRREMLHALGWSGRHEDPLLWQAFFKCVIADPDPVVRAAAANALLVGAGEDAEIAAGLQDRLEPRREQHAKVRAGVARSLARAGMHDARIRAALVRRLDPRREPSGDVRGAAAAALRFVAATDPRVRVALLARLDASAEPDADVRLMAVSGLAFAATDDVQIQARLSAIATCDPSADVRHRALYTLVNECALPPDVRRALPRFLDHRVEPDHNVRRTASQALGRIARTDLATRKLLVARLAEDFDEKHGRESLILALAAVVADDADVRQALFALLDPRAEPNPSVRRDVVHALGHALAVGATRDVLRSRLTRWREPDGAVRCTVARVLGAVATDPDVRNTLTELLEEAREPDARVRDCAAEALQTLTDLTNDLRQRIESQLATSAGQSMQIFDDLFRNCICVACADESAREKAIFDVP